LNTFTSTVQSNIIVSILVGSKWSFNEIPYLDLSTGEKSMKDVSAYMDKMLTDTMARFTTNPFAVAYPEMEVFAIDKRNAENCRQIRGFFGKIINEKKTAADPNAQDIVSLLL